MSSVVLIARILLAVVFATAAAAKLADLEGSRRTMEAFGMPDPVARYGGTLLPFAELATALALMSQPTARWGAVAALALLGIFIAGIGNALSHGQTPDCNCFGQVASARISWRTLARNVALVVIAALVVWKAPGSSLTAWTSNRTGANLVASIAVIACSLLVVVAIRYRVLSASARDSASAAGADAPPALEIGALAPRFSLPDLTGKSVALDALRDRGLPVLLVFASQSCGPCVALLPELARWNAALSDRITLVLVESGVSEREELAEQIRAAGDVLALYEGRGELAASYGIGATPTAVAVGPDGNIASAQATGSIQIEELVRVTLRRAPEPPRRARTLAAQPSAELSQR